MSKTELEKRLLDAASREEPSRELSERMARAIGVALPPAGSATSAGKAPSGSAGAKVTASSGSLVPWLAGALVVAALGAGVFLLRGARTEHAASPALPARTASAPVPPPAPRASSAPLAAAPKLAEQLPATTPAPAAAQHGRGGASAVDLGDQIALLDAARGALAAGDASGALSLARKYQSQYPSGTFRPEATAIKIEALVKLDRSAEARKAAEKFVASFGPGPLADRVARLAGGSKP